MYLDSDYFSDDPFHDFLAKYVTKNYKKWQKKYLNVIGVHVGQKMKSNIPTASEELAIIFHVITKTDSIGDDVKIPASFSVQYKGKRVKVETDVIKTGKSQLQHIYPGQNIFQEDNYEDHGTLGCIVIKDQQPHVLSNMHVLGYTHLFHTQRIIDLPINENAAADINVFDDGRFKPVGYFRSGIVNNRVDAAIALIPDGLLRNVNPLTHLFTVSNPIILPPSQMSRPLPVVMLGNVSGFVNTQILSCTATKTFVYPLGQQEFNYLLLMPYCSTGGDSGSAVYEPVSKRIIGIIVGADKAKKYTYAIPYSAIREELKLE